MRDSASPISAAASGRPRRECAASNCNLWMIIRDSLPGLMVCKPKTVDCSNTKCMKGGHQLLEELASRRHETLCFDLNCSVPRVGVHGQHNVDVFLCRKRAITSSRWWPITAMRREDRPLDQRITFRRKRVESRILHNGAEVLVEGLR